jgi:hypothetical protein
MANRKISDLTALTAPASGDFLPIVDISEAAAASKNKKITYSDFLNNIPTGTITSTMILDGTILNADINASAAIVDTKLATIATGGKVSGTAITSGNISTSGSFTSTSTVTGTNLIPTGSGVPTNGIYLPAANSVAVATNGTGRLFVDATGNVGVGAAANANGVLRLNVASGNNANLVFSENNTDRYILGQVTGDNALRVYDIVAASERLRITSGGLVGIGTSSVNALLEVNSSTAGNEVQRIEGAYSGSGSVTLTNWRRAGGAVAAAFKYNDGTSPLCMSIGTTTSHQFRIRTADTDAITIDTSQRVGIGITAPNRKLEVSDAGVDNFIRVNTTGATKSGIEFASSGTVYSQLYFTNVSPYDLSLLQQYTTGSLILGTNSTERARIDSSGRLLVGTSSSPTVGDPQYGLVRIQGNTSSASGFGLLSIGRGQAAASISSGSELGHIYFTANDGSPYASISGYSDAAGGSNDYPGRIVLATTADGASSPTERMRINSAGALKASLTGTYDNATSSYHELRTNTSGDWIAYFTQTTATNPNGVVIKYSGAAPNNTGSTFLYCEDTVGVKASIRSNGGIANFSANDVNLSDINSKKDISPAVGTWDCIKEWEIVNYRYKDQPDDADLNLGVIAQQVAESCPEVITVFQEATEDQPEKLGVKEQQMYWMAIKALQEAQVRIEALEADVAQLKGA